MKKLIIILGCIFVLTSCSEKGGKVMTPEPTTSGTESTSISSDDIISSSELVGSTSEYIDEYGDDFDDTSYYHKYFLENEKIFVEIKDILIEHEKTLTIYIDDDMNFKVEYTENGGRKEYLPLQSSKRLKELFIQISSEIDSILADGSKENGSEYIINFSTLKCPNGWWGAIEYAEGFLEGDSEFKINDNWEYYCIPM